MILLKGLYSRWRRSKWLIAAVWYDPRSVADNGVCWTCSTAAATCWPPGAMICSRNDWPAVKAAPLGCKQPRGYYSIYPNLYGTLSNHSGLFIFTLHKMQFFTTSRSESVTLYTARLNHAVWGKFVASFLLKFIFNQALLWKKNYIFIICTFAINNFGSENHFLKVLPLEWITGFYMKYFWTPASHRTKDAEQQTHIDKLKAATC